ncbi:MAG: hypothetical protein ACYCUM_14000 [Solirubrobacteraceae bacterium]
MQRVLRWRRRAWRLGAATCACVAFALAASAAAQAVEIREEAGYGATTTARLEAEINPQGVATTCEVQYTSHAAYEAGAWAGAATVPCSPAALGSGSTPAPAVAHLEGLPLGGDYDFRFLAESGGVSTPGATETFTTFGIESFTVTATNSKGEPYTQAGGHPYELTTEIAVNANYTPSARATPDASLRDVRVALPPGLIGNPAAIPTCAQAVEEEYRCPGVSQVGRMGVELMGDARKGQPPKAVNGVPLYNVTPPKGVAARFAADINVGISGYIDAGVRTGSDYGVNADSLNVTTFAEVKRIIVKLWGAPWNAVHDPLRGCPNPAGGFPTSGCEIKPEGPERAFLTMPTACEGPLSTGGSFDSYEEPAALLFARSPLPEVTGCHSIGFAPSLQARGTTRAADSPTGLDLALKVPQNEAPEAIASSDLKDATVVLPAGIAVNPSSADGLAACPETGAESVGFTGFAELNPAREPGVRTPQFTEGPATCPNASKIGTVTIHTPLLEHPLPGAMYLAQQRQNPFGSLLALYLTAYDPVSGVVIKLAGRVQLDPQTGQVKAIFNQNPQLPFEVLEVDLFGAKGSASGARSPLTTPQTCGAYVTASTLEPWSQTAAAGETGTPNATPASEPFDITEVAGGGPCARSEGEAPNAPAFEAGAVSPIAGTYSPFVVKLRREDGSQRLRALNVTLPPGMVGKVAGVEECPQADIEAAQRLSGEGDGALEQAHPSCPPGSEVGIVRVGVGSGKPYYVGGRVYFAGPYEGAPFSLVIDTPAIAGPFDLGNVVVRAAIYVNPSNAQVTVRSDQFPTILDGIPLDIRSLDVEMTRREFTLNPTSCNVMAVGGQAISTAGQTATLSSRFQAGGCDTMPFKPVFTASTSANHTRRHGASLDVRLQVGAGEANVAKVHVTLPQKLPAELATLKLACTEAQFASNPAGCPPGAFVGSAVAHTPILPVALTGSAIFVSHGSAGFPNLDLVLQGDGVTIVLVGDTFINKNGITTSTFPAVPDVPVSSFELNLTAGEHPALGGNGSFCEKPLYMPTQIAGQNGVLVTQRTRIAVHGCKPEIRVLGHSVHGSRARIRVRVTGAGRLIASGRGLRRVVRRVAKAKVVTISVALGRHDMRVIARHRSQRVNAKLTLRFVPKHGRPLSTHVRLLLR